MLREDILYALCVGHWEAQGYSQFGREGSDCYRWNCATATNLEENKNGAITFPCEAQIKHSEEVKT